MTKILLTATAQRNLESLESNPRKQAKVLKAIGLLQANPRHPGLNTHKYQSLQGPNGEAMFEAYVENRTPGAWRIWFHYGPGSDTITIWAISPHP